MYKHTQTGYLMLAIIPVILLPLWGVLRIVPRGGGPAGHAVLVPMLATIGVVAIVSVLFSALTVTVEGGQLTWEFRFSVARHSVPVAGIKRVSVVRNPLIYGWGIHRTPYGWLYNVSGREAVQVEMRDGGMFRLGSDEPEVLARLLTPPPG
jgi:hypothetical protein